MVLLFCILFFPAGNVKADDTLLPTAWDNRGVYLKRYSDLVSLDDGYMRVFYRENVVYIEYYDNDFNRMGVYGDVVVSDGLCVSCTVSKKGRLSDS